MIDAHSSGYADTPMPAGVSLERDETVPIIGRDGPGPIGLVHHDRHSFVRPRRHADAGRRVARA
jgi:hypothetical protein